MKYLKVLFLSLLASCSLIAEEIETIEDPSWTVDLKGGYAFGHYIGLDKNYGELGLFIAPHSYAPWVPFADLNGYWLSDNKWAASCGLGMRWLNPCSCRGLSRAWGANLYYDYRHGCRNKGFNRIGIGLESLGPCFDFRINGYIPVEDKQRCFFCFYDQYIGNYFWKQEENQFSFRGIDAEIGWRMWNRCDFSLYGAAGPYYYQSKAVKGFAGGFARLSLTWQDYLSFIVRVSYDREFRTKVQGEVLVNLPLYDVFSKTQECSCECSCSNFCSWLVQPVQRNNVIFTKRCRHNEWNW